MFNPPRLWGYNRPLLFMQEKSNICKQVHGVAALCTWLLDVSDADDVWPVLQSFGKEGIGHSQNDWRPVERHIRGMELNTSATN